MLFEKILEKPISWEDGYIIPSKEPGLGVSLNMDVVKKHCNYTSKDLHLSMPHKPYNVNHDKKD